MQSSCQLQLRDPLAYAEQFGFSPSKVTQDGSSLDAEEAQLVWQTIQESPMVTRFQDGGQTYAGALFIPGILEPSQGGRCW